MSEINQLIQKINDLETLLKSMQPASTISEDRVGAQKRDITADSLTAYSFSLKGRIKEKFQNNLKKRGLWQQYN